MRAVILAGGKGTRLRPYTTVLPKPLVPMGDRPILELILRQLVRDGFDRADLCVGHLGELIQVYLSESAELPDDLELEFHWEHEPLGTAGALRTIPGLDEPFLVMNGDILTDLDYAALMSAHVDGGAALTIACHRREVKIDLGVIEASDRSVTGFVEKPSMDFNVSMGIYAYSPSTLAHIPAGPFDFPDVVRALIDAEEPVSVYRHEGQWFDIGTYTDYELALEEVRRQPDLFDV
jgi:NDP-mannose synthase